MTTMETCPSCGKPVREGALLGLCADCLLKAGTPTGASASGATAFTPPTPAELAPLFPQLEILELLGRGGMGAVYKARQKELDRLVALKVLPPGIGDDPTFAGRFAAEARALARLNHPNIVTIHDSGRAEGQFFFVMEFVDGMSLRQLLNAGRISAREALAIVPQICDALQYAHDAGIVHRDIKPENILLDRRGRVKVADFGLAKLVGAPLSSDTSDRSDLSERNGATQAGVILGTPHYMAPEQVSHPSDVDHRADIYSLGVVFYQMLTGELPKGDFAPPSKRVVIDVRLDEVVLRALEQRPELRYGQVSELKTMCETIATNPSPLSHGVTAPPPSPAARFSRTAIVGSCLIALGLLSAVLSLFVDQMVASPDGLVQPHHPASPPAFALISAALLYACFATLLGWIAVSQISRSAGKLYGLGLAVFDGLFFPLLALDALIISAGLGLEVVSLLIIVVADIFIIRAVWGAVNKSTTPPVPPAVAPPRADAKVPMIGKTVPADFQSLETTNAVLMTPEELGSARGQFGVAFTRGPLALDGTRLVHRGNGRETVIPLDAIEDVSLGQFPRAMNPRRLPLVCVTYREGGASRRVLLAPWQQVIGLPSTFAAEVYRWHGLIRVAVERATGRPPTETPEAQLDLPGSSPVTVGLMLLPYFIAAGMTALLLSFNASPAMRWLLVAPLVPLLVLALSWVWPARKRAPGPRSRPVWLALLLPVLAAVFCAGSFVVGMLLRPHLQPRTGPFKVHCTPEGVTGRVVLVRMFTPDPLVRQELRMHLAGPELPPEDLLIPRNFSPNPRPDYFIFPRTSPAIQPWTDFGSAKQTLMGFVLPTPELAQAAYRRLGMGPLPLRLDRDRPPGAFHFDLDPKRPTSMTCVLFDVTNAVGQRFMGQLLFSAEWIRAGHPRWAEVRSGPVRKSLNTLELSWKVGTSRPAAMTLHHFRQDGGSETMAAFGQSSPTVDVSVLVYKMTDTRVGLRMSVGDQPNTKEFEGNFDAIATELQFPAVSGRFKTERDWDIELCRVAGGPVYLHISDLPSSAPTAVPASTQRSWHPEGAHIGNEHGTVFVTHDNVDVIYALYYAGQFGTGTDESFNPKLRSWHSKGAIELDNGKKFLYLRVQDSPETLRLNGDEFDLRQGSVIVLHDDGTAEQRKQFPSLAVAMKPAALAEFLAVEAGAGGGQR